jgi:RNA polymerase sigma-70 factor (ECF subfamily)
MELAVGIPVASSVAAKPAASTEAALVARAQRGDHQAFEALVRQHQNSVVNVARRIVGDSEAAQDVAQEAFIKAYRQLHRFRGDAAFATWLYSITVNEARAHLRSQKRRQARWEKERDLAAAETQVRTPDHQAEPLLALMQELPEKQRAALALFYLEELSLNEIAQASGAPTGTVKAWLSRGRERLRQLAVERGLL